MQGVEKDRCRAQMKKFAVLLLWVAFVELSAAPVGDPSTPQLIEEGFFISRDSWIDVRAGYEGDFVADARMKQCEEGSGRVDSYKQDTKSGALTINMLDRVDVYGIFGSSRTYSSWRYSDPADNIHRAEIETFYQFLWAVGSRGILYEWGNTVLGMGGRSDNEITVGPLITRVPLGPSVGAGATV